MPDVIYNLMCGTNTSHSSGDKMKNLVAILCVSSVLACGTRHDFVSTDASAEASTSEDLDPPLRPAPMPPVAPPNESIDAGVWDADTGIVEEAGIDLQSECKDLCEKIANDLNIACESSCVRQQQSCDGNCLSYCHSKKGAAASGCAYDCQNKIAQCNAIMSQCKTACTTYNLKTPDLCIIQNCFK